MPLEDAIHVVLDPDRNRRRVLSDAELVMQVRAGDLQAFDKLALRYQAALKRVARSRLGRDDWAEDVVQESLLAAFKSCGTYDPRYSFRTWLWTILLNQCYHHYQRRSRRAVHEYQGTDGNAEKLVAEQIGADRSPLEALMAKERSELLEQLLRRLSDPQADALRLRFFGGLKFYEIAEAMQCSLNTAKLRVRQGLVNLAGLLGAPRNHRSSERGSESEVSAV